ncbi:hypothetical protein [Massilia sp. TS11]|uniref:hypothetical protein n=1 Tax=Massilia sp. TS11 TaxID=2908003 RepID=UPI001EDC8BA4|nr:hypothetical protein [Massilia sp. TS11]MCG2583830.1 hypothetical protein [Massilia sp. TS11]
MKAIIRNVLAVVFGLLIGATLNGLLIKLGPHLIAPPAGADVTTLEGLKASLPLFEPRHFLFPWLAHALGTLVGAALATAVAVGARKLPPAIVGLAFLLGGAMNVAMLPAPLWFDCADLLLAYVPMAWLGRALALRFLPAPRV